MVRPSCRSAAGAIRLDVRTVVLDSELDEEQPVGHIPQGVLEELWPRFVPQNLEVWINPLYVRRHVGSGQRDYVERVAAFNQNVNGLAAGFESPSVYAKYEGVPRADADLTVYLEVEPDHGSRAAYVAVGVHMFPAGSGDRKRNHVTTVIPPMNAKRLKRRLEKVPHVLPSDESA